MKSASVASVFLAAVAVAQPHGNHHQHLHNKRAIVTETKVITEVEYVTQLIDSTTTVWITPGAKKVEPTTLATTTSSTYVAPPKETKETKETTSTSVPPPPPPAPTTTTSVYVPPPPPPETTSVYVAPAPAPEPEKPTSQYVPPAQPTTAAAPAVFKEKETGSTSGGSTGGESTGGGGGGYSGEVTFYDVGLGSCGDTSSESEPIVALSHEMMGTVSNGNSYCGKKVTITVNGKTATGIVKDKCMGCDKNNIDVSRSLFAALGLAESVGRTKCTWSLS